MSEFDYDLCVVGGGPAGMMAAGRAAECGEKVLLLEKNGSLGKKLLITGGGRCNVTNAETRRHVLAEKYGDRGRFLYSLFARFGPDDVRGFFRSFGLDTHVEAENRVFPVTNRAQSVLDVLVSYLKRGGVDVRTRTAVSELLPGTVGSSQHGPQGHIDAVRTGGDLVRARRFVVATGGTSHPETGSTGDGFVWLRKIGHSVQEPEASLVPILTRDSFVREVQGLSFQDVRLTVAFSNDRDTDQGVQKDRLLRASERGKLLITHFGLSGPLALNLSARIREIERSGQTLYPDGRIALLLDLFPDEDYSQIDRRMLDAFQATPNRKLRNTLHAVVPSRLTHVLLHRLGIDEEKPVHSVSRDERRAIVTAVKSFPLTFAGFRGKGHAVVSSGGVALEEIDFRTMRSTLYDNLFLAGDILDFQRRSGGYSLQICWASGWVAGNQACGAVHST